MAHPVPAPARAVTIPPQAYFLVSAIFHYLGPAFAVLLFAQVATLGVAWLRIASAALIVALWRRPWRAFARSSWAQRRTLLALGATLGARNATFYLAIARQPLGPVGGIEFLGPILLAALGTGTLRNVFALVLAVAGPGCLPTYGWPGSRWDSSSRSPTARSSWSM